MEAIANWMEKCFHYYSVFSIIGMHSDNCWLNASFLFSHCKGVLSPVGHATLKYQSKHE